MRAAYTRLLLCLASGLALHALFFAWLFFVLPSNSAFMISGKKSGQEALRVPIALELKPRRAPAAADKKASSRPIEPSNTPPSKTAATPHRNKSSAAPAAAGDYGALLPQAGELSLPQALSQEKTGEAAASFAQHQFLAGISGKEKQALLREGGTLAALFDLPLALRQQKRELRAHAAISQRAGELRLEYLDGEPILRAVIYEALQNPKAQQVLRRALALLDGRRLRIEISTRPEERLQADGESSFFWRGANLILLKTPPPPSGGGGIALPDRAAEAAKAWDRQALLRLQDSLAYRKPLRQKTL